MKKTFTDITKQKRNPIHVQIADPILEADSPETPIKAPKKLHTKRYLIIFFITVLLIVGVYFWFMSIKQQGAIIIDILQKNEQQEEIYLQLQKPRKKLNILLLPLRPIQKIIPIYRQEISTIFLGIDILGDIQKAEHTTQKIIKKSVKNNSIQPKILVEKIQNSYQYL